MSDDGIVPRLFPGRWRMLGPHGGLIVSDEEFAAARLAIPESVSDDDLMTALENAAVSRRAHVGKWATPHEAIATTLIVPAYHPELSGIAPREAAAAVATVVLAILDQAGFFVMPKPAK